MRYDLVPTTVFTPLEYGAIGLSEESAIEKYGEDNIEVYHSTFRPLEMFLAKRMADDCYVKLVCNKARNETVLGFHILGPHAGEMTQVIDLDTYIYSFPCYNKRLLAFPTVPPSLHISMSGVCSS